MNPTRHIYLDNIILQYGEKDFLATWLDKEGEYHSRQAKSLAQAKRFVRKGIGVRRSDTK